MDRKLHFSQAVECSARRAAIRIARLAWRRDAEGILTSAVHRSAQRGRVTDATHHSISMIAPRSDG